MRLIDVDFLAQFDHWENIVYQLSVAPTIDAVPVVRCKDCRSYLEEDGGWCLEMDRSIEPTDFCSYAERKE